MNSIRLLFIVFLISNSVVIYSQDSLNQIKTTSKNHYIIIKTDILNPVVTKLIQEGASKNCVSMSLEVGIKQKSGLQFTTIYNDGYYNEEDWVYYKYWSVQFFTEYKYYLNPKRKFTGWYTGGYIKLLHYHDKFIVTDQCVPIDQLYSLNDIGMGPHFGYQNHYKHFVVDILFGFGWLYTFNMDIIKNIGATDESLRSFPYDGRILWNFGYLFYRNNNNMINFDLTYLKSFKR
jgi:hypothetical protein